MVVAQIEHEITIEAPRERVWQVLTQPRHVAEWFGDSAEIDLRPGGKAVFGWKEHGQFQATVEKVVPHDFFSYRWAHEADEAPVTGRSTLVEFTLIAEGADTRLKVVESGFDRLSLPPEQQRKHAEENTEGWHQELEELRQYVVAQ